MCYFRADRRGNNTFVKQLPSYILETCDLFLLLCGKVNPANAHNLATFGKNLALDDQHHQSIVCKSLDLLMEILQCVFFLVEIV